MQNGFGAFDSLVQELSTSERRDMLEKVQGSISVSWDPTTDDDAGDAHEHVDATVEFYRMPFFTRLWILLLKAFSGQTREQLVHERLIRRHATTLGRRYPEIFERRNSLVLPGFFQAVDGLSQSVRPLSGALSRALGRNEPTFLAFLLSLEMESVQRELASETDPFEISREDPEMPEPEVRRRMMINLDYVFESMPSDGRARMYDSARFLHALHRVANFPFQTISGRAVISGEDGAGGCPVGEIATPLSDLAGALAALRSRPSPRLMEAVFLFAEQERIPSGDYNLADGLSRRLRGASLALSQIREFMVEVPVVGLSRVALEDINYEPRVVTGGEDWFALVKRFWSDRCDKLYGEYVLSVQKRRYSRDIEQLVDAGPVQALRSYRTIQGEEGQHARSIGALLLFMRNAFRHKMLSPLKTLLIDGEFYKSENRSEYDEAFEILSNTEQVILDFQQRLETSGDLGMTIDHLRTQPHDADYPERLDKAMRKIDARASEILNESIAALRTVAEVVNGILYGEVGGRYDTLANLGQIGGRSNKVLMSSLDAAMRTAQSFLAVFMKLVDLERGTGRPN
ncbi:MAG: hypothetical protein EA428_11730 [Spirochaetaceae bacterium]|nr:MAG: hypothetical protein EA428_11730 [Spirochaetaceae bacterium]